MRYGTPNLEYVRRLGETPADADGPVWMVNLMRYRERAEYADGRETTLSGREADDRYAPVSVLAELGASVALFGDVVGDGGADGWHRVGIVRYPTRRSFIAMQDRPDFQELHVHKDAGMDFTIIAAGVPAPGAEAPRPSADTVGVTFHPAGAEPPAAGRGALRLDVEGTVIGDERRWAAIDLGWSGAEPAAAPGAISVRVRPAIDAVAALLATAVPAP